MAITKSGLIEALGGVYTEVCTPELVRTDTYNGKQKKTYRAAVTQVTGNRARFFSIIFYVLNEGLGDEIAYYDMDQAPQELI